MVNRDIRQAIVGKTGINTRYLSFHASKKPHILSYMGRLLLPM